MDFFFGAGLLGLGAFVVVIPVVMAYAFDKMPKAVRWFMGAAVPLSFPATIMLVMRAGSTGHWVGAGHVPIPPQANAVYVPACLAGAGGVVVLMYGVAKGSWTIGISGVAAVLAAVLQAAAAGAWIGLAHVS